MACLFAMSVHANALPAHVQVARTADETRHIPQNPERLCPEATHTQVSFGTRLFHTCERARCSCYTLQYRWATHMNLCIGDYFRDQLSLMPPIPP